jgi:hypothetical protein
MIARITSKATCVSTCTPQCYKQIFLMQNICTVEGKQSSPLWVNGYLSSTFFKTLQFTHITHHSIHYTQNYEVSLGRCLQREFSLQFTACLLLLMQTQHLCNDIYYLTMHEILKVWVKLVDSILCHTIHILPKWDPPANIVHSTTHFIHITVHISKKIL